MRSIVYLRLEKSLPRIRKAVATLAALEASEWEHLANYRLISSSIPAAKPNRAQVLHLRPG